MAEKASYHKAKISGQAGERHMERDFDERDAEHIDESRTYLNVCRSFCPGDKSELAFYKMRYGKSLEEQNARYRKKGNYDRVRTMKQVYETNTKRPTEEVLQYSKHGGVEIPKEVYDEIVSTYVRKLQVWGFKNGGHYHVLKYASHFDEVGNGSVHTHLRSIWDWTDENGVVHIGQEKGMEQSGLKIPDEEKLKKDIARAEEHKAKAEEYVTEWDEKKDDEGHIISRKPKTFSDKKAYDSEMRKYRSGVAAASRFNNRSITWTNMQRQMWEDTLEEFGYACDRERAPKAKHLSKTEWDNKMNALMQEIVGEREQMQHEREEHAARIAELEWQIREQRSQIEQNRIKLRQQDTEIETAERAERVKPFDISKYNNIAKFST